MTYRIDDLEVPAESPFLHDALDRKPLVEFLSSLIKRLNGPFVMALDSPWGTGKTTLVRMLEAVNVVGRRPVVTNQSTAIATA
ncbi:MAG: P-loop NTPase fold protein [Burkholderiaceae bacterium]